MMEFRNLFFFLALLSVYLTNGEMLGKFVFHGDNGHDHQKSAISILHKPDSMLLAPSPGAIPSNELASVLALSLGLSVPRDIKWSGLQVNNPFKLPKGVMMFSIDNLPKGHVLNMASTATYPVENVDGVSSISDMYYVAPKYSISSHVNEIFEGQSRIVSISGDESVAGSGHSNSPLGETSIWSELTKSWKVVSGDGEVRTTLSKKEILKRIPDILISGYTYQEKQQSVSVNIKGMEFSFNLDDNVDFKLFSELVYIFWQYNEIADKKSLVRDNAPDLYLMSISALKGIEKKYGADSQHMRGALMLIEKFVGKIVNGFVKLYDGNIFVVGLTVTSETGYLDDHKDDLKPALKLLEDNKIMVINLDNSGSEIHIVDKLEADAQRKLCEAVQGSLGQSSKSLKFKCANDLPMHTLRKRSLLEYAGKQADAGEADLNLSSRYDDRFPVIFNMWFWLIVLLTVIVYATSLAMWNMDPGRDSIIYRLTQQKIKSE